MKKQSLISLYKCVPIEQIDRACEQVCARASRSTISYMEDKVRNATFRRVSSLVMGRLANQLAYAPETRYLPPRKKKP